VIERPSGSVMFGVGYGQESGILLNASLTQNNFLGTGNQFNVILNNSGIGQNYSIFYNNPYHTIDGVSRGFRVFFREIDSAEANTADFILNSYGAQVIYGFPLNEFDTLRLTPGFEHIWIDTTGNTPVEILDEIERNGDTFDQFKLEASWARDSRNRAFFPTSGGLNQVSAELAIPGSDAEFYKLSYRNTTYFPLNRWLTGSVGGDVGYGDGYGDTDDLPFFENFYAGGLRSVRGYRANTLGPRYSNDEPSGGAFRTTATAQLILPVPFMEKSENIRIATFFDVGNVFADVDDFDFGELRYSIGVSGLWLSPLGPIVLSLAAPLNDQSGDETQFFQFSFGVPF
jgi:outer membrane protein insertion porin family